MCRLSRSQHARQPGPRGSLPLISDILRPQAEIFAKLAGCKFIAIGGRRGWLGAWRRFGYMAPLAGKPYWTAAKLLTENPLDIQPLRAKMGQFRIQAALAPTIKVTTRAPLFPVRNRAKDGGQQFPET